jgi:hypothetical protein
VSAVARVAGIHPSQLYWWRRQLCARPLVGFASVRIAPEGCARRSGRSGSDRDRVCDRVTDADHRRSRHGDANGDGCGSWPKVGADDPNSFGGARVDCTGHTNMHRGMNSLALLVQVGPVSSGR